MTHDWYSGMMRGWNRDVFKDISKLCEAMVLLDSWRHDTPKYAMCGKPGEIHHRLTRARGGKILDKAGETYHLVPLCREHHNFAHSAKGAHTGLMLDGSVTTCKICKEPYYIGDDPFLTSRYGDGAHSITHKVVR